MVLFNYAGEFGPAKIIHICEPAVGLKEILVVVNVAMGPSIGGVRIAADVSVEEYFRLARRECSGNFTTGKYSAREAAIEWASKRIKKAMSFRRSLFSSAPDFI